MMSEHSDLILAHYGVKGMKWGRRKARGTTAKSKTRTKKPLPTEQQVARLAATVWVGTFMLRVARDVTPFLIGTAINAHQAKQGAAFAASMLADRGLTNYKTIVVG